MSFDKCNSCVTATTIKIYIYITVYLYQSLPSLQKIPLGLTVVNQTLVPLLRGP